MCGIAGIMSLDPGPVPEIDRSLAVMSHLVRHRGPDDCGLWVSHDKSVGLAHRRLSIIDLSQQGHQPMSDREGNWVVFNGEIYNYRELRNELGSGSFSTDSDTETILHAYRRWGADCPIHLRGMFSFALWDARNQVLFCARDRFGIKPFYYTVYGSRFYFASEAKALLPFIDIETDIEGLKDYLAFQFCLDGKTLFRNITELMPGHTISVRRSGVKTSRYWDVYFSPNFEYTELYYERKLQALLHESISMHVRSDVAIGAYVSGGLDSSIVASLASQELGPGLVGFTGKFSLGPEYDESSYARTLADHVGMDLHELDITAQDFIDNIQKAIYHMDYPAAGPGMFAQYMISGLASRYRKVVLGGQGGDEIFGGYARYLIAYFEQCIRAAIDGTTEDGRFIVTYQSIIPNLTALQQYKPLLQEFWSEGLFEPMDKRYFRLVDRSRQLGSEIRWDLLGPYSPYETFHKIFHGENVEKRSYFDLMTHFDFKTLLPALLQVEDRMSMAHGLESRVPLLDHPLVELTATMPSNIKFKDGEMKHIFKETFASCLPEAVRARTNKMGFPTPFNEWAAGPAKQFVQDVFASTCANTREFIDNRRICSKLSAQPRFGRSLWGLFCLELWHQTFHDRSWEFKRLLKSELAAIV
jgi:asparagine synthase (glutamine-hydrolysing)